MCGITGFIDFSLSSKDDLQKVVNKMQFSILHRGPDSHGCWLNSDDHIALGHQRLAILDLSEAGKQPMQSPSSRFVIVFNGEIYNHLSIRDEIFNKNSSPIKWIGHSDTETLLAAFECFGIEKTLKKTHGMFAMAIWDTQKKRLVLARDRMGEKPLYYGNVGNAFVFGSELKAIKQFPNFKNNINKFALEKYFQYNYVPSPLSIYEGIQKLEPGTIIEFNFSETKKYKVKKKEYWSFEALQEKCMQNQFQSQSEAFEQIETTLENAIRSQLISDVPLGVFLSGGIDSSLVTSLASKHLKKIKTFTIGFENSEYDESSYAYEVSNYLETDHTELTVTEKDVIQIINELSKIYDEPFADSSQIPTYFVCKAAKERVTVALSGDGADELFGGYNRYILSASIWKKFSWMPQLIRKLIGSIILRVPFQFFDRLYKLLMFGGSKNKISVIGNKIHKVGLGLFYADTLLDFCKEFTLSWREAPVIKKLNINDESSINNFSLNSQNYIDPITNMMTIDSLTYLPDDILCKVDRASMASSLETRAPFLDHKVIETALKTPSDFMIRKGKGKLPLRSILSKYLPENLINRPKSGFAIPIGDWLRGPLKKWAEDLLEPSLMDSDGLLDVELVQEAWRQHLSGQIDLTSKLWGVLIFQSWLRENR